MIGIKKYEYEKNNYYWCGVRHIFSPNIVSKYQLCKDVNEIYNLNIQINKNNTYHKNMTITSFFDNNQLNDSIPEIKQQIIEQYSFLQP